MSSKTPQMIAEGSNAVAVDKSRYSKAKFSSALAKILRTQIIANSQNTPPAGITQRLPPKNITTGKIAMLAHHDLSSAVQVDGSSFNKK
jgi:hypothetical protein